MLSSELTSALLTFYINLLMNTFDIFSLGRNLSPEKTLSHEFFNCCNKHGQANFNQRGLMSSFHTTYVNAS